MVFAVVLFGLRMLSRSFPRLQANRIWDAANIWLLALEVQSSLLRLSFGNSLHDDSDVSYSRLVPWISLSLKFTSLGS